MCVFVGAIMLICVLSVFALGISLINATARIKAMEYDINVISEVLAEKESRIDEGDEGDGDYVSPVPNEFDARIARLRDELNDGPAYAENKSQTYHPGVYNVPHASVEDVNLPHVPEYAD